ncbi:MAG: hypothetical protein E4H10_17745 [Bacteroidia bacterium]|nr:MAG: hypothetical protein E4H10_17745 [Bacteroidia bacterium]
MVADLGNEAFFNKCLEYTSTVAPTNTPGEFIAACGAAGLGKLVSEGKYHHYERLRHLASDIRWRVREGVAMALQYAGRKDFHTVLSHIDPWIQGNLYEQRALVAGLCEPDLLKDKEQVKLVLERVFSILHKLSKISDRKGEPFRVLRKGLGYGISVSIVAYPEKGKPLFENIIHNTDPDVQWIVRENLKKNRLIRMDPDWVNAMKTRLS